MPTTGDVYWAGARRPYRDRTLTCRWEGSLPRFTSAALAPFPLPGYVIEKSASAWMTAPGSMMTPASITIIAGINRGLGWYVEVADGFGGANAYEGRSDALRPPLGSASNNSTFVATWSLTNVRTYFEIYFLNEGVAGANGDPNYGGVASNDVNPRAIGIRFYEVALAGAVASCSVTVTGPAASASTSCSTTLTSPVVVSTYGASAKVLATVINNTTGAQSTSASIEFSGGNWEDMGPGTTLTDSDSYMSCSIAGGLLTANVTAPAYGGSGPTQRFGGAQLGGEPNRTYKVLGHLYALDKNYPDSLTLAISGSPAGEPQSVVLNPSGNATFRQRTFTAKSIRDNLSEITLGSAADWERIRTWLTNASLLAAGEDPRDWVTMFADSAYNALQLAHDETTGLPDPVEASGVWSHDFGGTPGNWEGYRYLRVRMKTDTIGEKVRLRVSADPSKTYEVTTTSTALTDYDIDLCRPLAPNPETVPELWDSRYPLRNDGLPHRDPATWGVGRVRSYSLSGGTNLTVDAVTLARKESAVHDPMVAFLDWETTQNAESYAAGGGVGSVPIVQGSRGVVVTTDGRRSIIEPCSTRQLMSDGSGGLMWVYGGRTARDLMATFNACPGFSASDSPYTPSDGWKALDGSEGANLINGGPIYYAGWSGFHHGGGILWSGQVPDNVLGTVLTASTPVQYQPRYHEVIGYPAMGDVWGDDGGSYDTPTNLRVGKILRAAADGLSYESTDPIELYDDVPALRSSTTRDVILRYRQGDLPYGKAQHDHTVECGPLAGQFLGEWDPDQGLGEADATQERFNARRWHRAVFLAKQAQSAISYDVGRPSARHLRAYVTAGLVVISRAGNDLVWTEELTAIDAETLCLRIEHGSQGQALWLAVGYAGNVLLYRSWDEGRNWSLMATIASGEHPQILIGRDAKRYLYWIDGNAVKGQIRDAANNVLTSTFTAVSGVDASGLAVAESILQGGGVRIVLHCVVSGSVTQYTSRDGITFSP